MPVRRFAGWKRRSRQWSPALFVLALMFGAAGSAVADEPAWGFADEPFQEASLQHWIPTLGEAPWFENWNFRMWAEDGTFILVEFGAASYGLGLENRATGRLVLVDPGQTSDGEDGPGRAFADRSWEGDRGQWTHAQDRLELIFDDCYLRGDDSELTLRIRGRDRRTTFEATLTPVEPLYRPGDGRIEVGWDHASFLELESLPRFQFEGRILRKADRNDPEEWQELQGVGHGRYSRSNALPQTIADHFQGFRALRPDGLSIAIDTLLTPPAFSERLIGNATVTLDGQRIFDSLDVQWVPDTVHEVRVNHVPYPVPLAFEGRATQGDNWLLVRFTEGTIVSSDSPFGRLGSFLRRTASGMGSPREFDVAGVYEAWIHVDGRTVHVRGTGWSTSLFSR